MPGSSKTSAILNQIAASPRKSLNEVDKADDRPNRRPSSELQSVGSEDVAIGTETSRKRARLSRSTLSKPSTDTMGSLRAAARIYTVPDSPEHEVASRERDASTPRLKPKAPRNKHIRPLNGKKGTDASPLRSIPYGAIDLKPGVNLTSHNSPAKVNRRKPSRKPRFEAQPTSKEVEVTDLDKERRVLDLQVSGNDVKDPAASESASGPSDPGQTADLGRNSPERGEEDEMAAEEAYPAGSKEVVNDAADDSDAALAQAIQRQHKPRSGKAVNQQAARELQKRTFTSNANVAVASEQSLGADENDENEEDDGDGDETEGRHVSATNVAAPSQRRTQRKGMTEAEREERRQAEARQRDGNVQESEHAAADLRREQGGTFVTGIIDVLNRADVGSVELWSRLGAASTEITKSAGIQREMDTTRAQALNRTLHDLKAITSSQNEHANADMEDALRRLKTRTTRQFLRPDDTSNAGDPTVVNLFQFLIPKAVSLIRRYLRLCFREDSGRSWRELHALVKATRTMCDVALSWTPKPSTIEAGIRGNVYNNIRPNLADILRFVTDGLRSLEYRESHAVARREAAQALATVRRKRDEFEAQMERDLNQRISRIGLSARQSTSRHRISRDEVVDIDDIADNESPPWTDVEGIVLLNGLQKYQGADRFLLIRKSEDAYLQNRTADECIAQAMYYKRQFAQAGRTFDWLEDL